MGRNQYWAVRVYDLCVYYMTGTPEGSTESGFMEKRALWSYDAMLRTFQMTLGVHLRDLFHVYLNNLNFTFCGCI